MALYIICAVALFGLAVYVMVTIEVRKSRQWWRYALYIAALTGMAVALSGVFESTTSRIGIGCAVIVLAARALISRSKNPDQAS